jgi:hypothetical protein
LLQTDGGDVGFLIGVAGMGLVGRALADWTIRPEWMRALAAILLTATGCFATKQLLNAKAKQ